MLLGTGSRHGFMLNSFYSTTPKSIHTPLRAAGMDRPARQPISKYNFAVRRGKGSCSPLHEIQPLPVQLAAVWLSAITGPS